MEKGDAYWRWIWAWELTKLVIMDVGFKQKNQMDPSRNENWCETITQLKPHFFHMKFYGYCKTTKINTY